jgi:ribonuclease P protein component
MAPSPDSEKSSESCASPDGFTRPREVRLRRSAEFLHVRQQGKIATGRYLRISVARALADSSPKADPAPKSLDEGSTAEESESRVGIITTRRIGGAVLRVRVRRRLRELHRLSRPDLRRGRWIVLIGKREAATAPWSALCTEWLHLGQKLSIFGRT